MAIGPTKRVTGCQNAKPTLLAILHNQIKLTTAKAQTYEPHKTMMSDMKEPMINVPRLLSVSVYCDDVFSCQLPAILLLSSSFSLTMCASKLYLVQNKLDKITVFVCTP